MKLIKLIDSTNSKTVYLVSEHLVSFWEEDGKTIVTTSNGDEILIEESPEQILKMLNGATKNIKRLMEYA